jgi:hypothetical protein
VPILVSEHGVDHLVHVLGYQLGPELGVLRLK